MNYKTKYLAIVISITNIISIVSVLLYFLNKGEEGLTGATWHFTLFGLPTTLLCFLYGYLRYKFFIYLNDYLLHLSILLYFVQYELIALYIWKKK